MAASEIVKLCWTKMAILFTHAAAQVNLGGRKRHFSVEWTHDREISGEIPSLSPAGAFRAPAMAQNKARINATCNDLPLFTRCGRPLASRLDSRTSGTQGSCCSETHWQRFSCLSSGHLLCLLQKPDLYVFAFLLDILLKYCYCL